MPDEVILNINMKMWDCIHLVNHQQCSSRFGQQNTPNLSFYKRKLSIQLKQTIKIIYRKEDILHILIPICKNKIWYASLIAKIHSYAKNTDQVYSGDFPLCFIDIINTSSREETLWMAFKWIFIEIFFVIWIALLLSMNDEVMNYSNNDETK